MWFKIICTIFYLSDLISADGLYDTNFSRNSNNFSENFQYRLPNNTRPLKYWLQITTDVHLGEREFSGKVKIHFETLENSNQITLHSRQITINTVDLLNSTNSAVIESNVPITFRDDVDFLIISPMTNLIKGEEYHVEISYRGLLSDENIGFYISNYVRDGKKVPYAATNFAPHYARNAFPCYDEPAIRAAFSIEIRHDVRYISASNTAQESKTQENGTNYVVSKFYDAPPIQSFFVAFVISTLGFIQNNSNSVAQRVFAKPQSISAGEADFALSISWPIMLGFEQYFYIPFAFSKMDQFALPDFRSVSNMGYWGIISYPETYLLLSSSDGTSKDQDNVIKSIANRFTHQFLPSIEWWSYLWINQGLATLYGSYIPSLVFPDAGFYMDTFLMDTFQPAMEFDADPGVRSMSTYVESPENVLNLFDSVTSSKAGCVLRMFQNAFGDAIWKKGLFNFIAAKSYDYATSDHLYKNIQNAVDEFKPSSDFDVALAMKTWEKQPGFPYVTVKRTGNSLQFVQDRFMYELRNSTNIWWLPLNYVVESNPDFQDTKPDLWIFSRSTTVIANSAPKKFSANDWIIVNIQQTSFYRVNYDNNLWKMITRQLKENFLKIHAFNRAQLIDDSFHLARANLIDYDIFFEILVYLENETSYVPWESFNRAYPLLNRWLQGTNIFPKFQAFVQKKIGKLFSKLGIELIKNESRADSYTRSVAINIACSSNMPLCLTRAKEYLENFVESGVSIAPDLAGVIFCNGVKTTSEHIFFKLYEVYSSSSKQTLKNTILNSLGCTRNTTLLKSHLSFAIENSLTKTQILQIFTLVDHGKPTLNVLIDFVKENYNNLARLEVLLPVCNEIASRIFDQNLFDNFLSLLDYLELKLKLNLETYKNSANFIDWQIANLATVQNFLEGHEQTSITTEITTAESITTETTFPTSEPTTSSSTPSDQTSSLLLLLVLTVPLLLNISNFVSS